MAQYTRCVEYQDFKNHWQGSSQSPVLPLFFNAASHAIYDMFLGALGGAGIGALFGPGGILVGAGFGAWVGFNWGFVDGFCDQWLNWRLICVKRDQCACARVAWIETVAGKFEDDPIEWLFDNDLSFNLRLVPYNGKKFVNGHWKAQFAPDSSETYGLDKIVADQSPANPFPSALLLQKPKKSDGTDWDLSYNGYSGSDKPDHPGGRWTLHSEIEGNGMQTLCTIAKVFAALGPLGQAAGIVGGIIVGGIFGAVKGYELAHDGCKKVCSIPIVCDIICFFVGLAGAVVGWFVGIAVGAIAGAIPGLGAILIGGLLSVIIRHNGSFSDVANDPDSGNIENEDCVFVAGDQVYDAGHSDGWVEIHPVRHLQKICSHDKFVDDAPYYNANCCPGKPTDSPDFRGVPFATDVKAFWDRWCSAYATSRDPITVGAQQDPENLWCTHPLIDGCVRQQEQTPLR